jgi:superfamily II DNA or RNA helicase
MIKKISRNGYSIEKDSINNKELQKIKSELTVKPFVLKDYTTANKVSSFKLYRENSNKIYIPRFYGLNKYGPPLKEEFPKTNNYDFEFNGGLREEQLSIYDTIINSIHTRGGGILSLHCGGGKTVISLYLISQLKLPTLVIVHKDFLMTQWKERINEFLPNIPVGKIQQNTIDIENKPIVLAMVQSISMKEYDSSIFDNFGLVVFDECHHLGAEVFSKCMPKVATNKMFGLSATPTRKDGLTKVFEWYIGPIVYKSKNKKSGKVDVKIIKYYEEDENYGKEIVNYRKKPCIPKMINNICSYEPRNTIIINNIKDCYNEGRNILLLSDRRGHLLRINTLLTENSIDSGFYVGGMKSSALKESEEKQVILGTFSMASEGMDIPKLNTIILASPKSDIVQSIGRILREKEENRKKIPLIIDINDNFSIFINQSKKRLTYYNKNKYDIIIVNKDGTHYEMQKEESINMNVCLI